MNFIAAGIILGIIALIVGVIYKIRKDRRGSAFKK